MNTRTTLSSRDALSALKRDEYDRLNADCRFSLHDRDADEVLMTGARLGAVVRACREHVNPAQLYVFGYDVSGRDAVDVGHINGEEFADEPTDILAAQIHD